jgi:hypothetical protein
MTFNEWKETKEYKELIEIFGNFGYVEAIAELSYLAGQENKKIEPMTTSKPDSPTTIY